MSIELKQASEKALIVLGSATSFMSRKARDQHESVVAELRTAIQQAESEPCKSFTELRDRHREGVDAELAAMAAEAKTDEPVAWPLRAQVWKRESTQEWVLEIAGTLGDTDMNIRHTQPLSVAYENVPGLPTFYTHPAPGVPDGVVRGVVEELHKLNEYAIVYINDPEWTRVSDTCQKLIGAIDAAMLAAAQAQKGQP